MDQKGEGAASGDSRLVRPQSDVTVRPCSLAALGSQRRLRTSSPTEGLVTVFPSVYIKPLKKSTLTKKSTRRNTVY